MSSMIAEMNLKMEKCDADVGQHEPLSLLNLVDMALALESQKDHTYAYIKSNEEENAECLFQKERDHNYSYCSKGVSRCRATQAEPISQRSSSEENLSRFIGSAPRSAPPRITADDSSLGFVKSRKFHSYETISNPFLSEHTYSSAISSRQPEASGSYEFKSATDDGVINLCSSSWPKENMFPSSDRQMSWKTFPMNYKFDHTYARWQNNNNVNSDTNTCVCDDPNCCNSKVKIHRQQELVPNVGTKNDHTYDKAAMQKKKSRICESKLKLLSLHRSDHNYSGSSQAVPNQTLGSVESLDMELSQSDTDSCDETAHEEKKLAITSTISAWLQLRKDHPYSSI